MATLNEIRDFLAPKKFAIAGVSRNEKKFGGAIFKELKEKGYEIYPVNPNADKIKGVKCYHSVSELPADVKHLLIVTAKRDTVSVAREAVAREMEMIWIQQKSETPEAVALIEKAGIPLICKKCIMMFADPVKGFHHFHRALVKFFGGYPKMVAPSTN